MPQDIRIQATSFTPEIDFRFSENFLAMQGECYPENAAIFFAPIIEATESYLNTLSGETINVRVQLRYFNSSSTKLIFTWLDKLNGYGSTGYLVNVDWLHDCDDDSMQEFGMELQDDFPATNIQVMPHN